MVLPRTFRFHDFTSNSFVRIENVLFLFVVYANPMNRFMKSFFGLLFICLLSVCYVDTVKAAYGQTAGDEGIRTEYRDMSDQAARLNDFLTAQLFCDPAVNAPRQNVQHNPVQPVVSLNLLFAPNNADRPENSRLANAVPPARRNSLLCGLSGKTYYLYQLNRIRI